MIITGAMMATAAAGGLGAITNFMGKQSQAAQANKARIQQFKQQMLIRDVRDQQRFGIYNTKKVAYQQNLNALDRRFALGQTQDNLRMNELLKGSKLASQNKLVNEVQAAGKVAASTASGNSSAKLKQSAMAALGRQAQVRQDQLTSSVYAKQLKAEADVQSLNAAKMKEFNQIRFAPQQSPQSLAPTMESGPSPFSLIAGIGQAALGGLSTGLSQESFMDDIQNNQPNRVQIPT